MVSGLDMISVLSLCLYSSKNFEEHCCVLTAICEIGGVDGTLFPIFIDIDSLSDWKEVENLVVHKS